MDQSITGEIGLMYYFQAKTTTGDFFNSDTGYTYIQYPGDGQSIPDLTFGEEITDYQILSIPLELIDRNISSLLEDQLGTYDPKKWRLLQHSNDQLIKFKSGLSIIEPGKGYWLITRNSKSLTTGEGKTVAVTEENPFVLSLKAGWNQIGNLYNFNLLWQDIKDQNPNLNIGELFIYKGGFQ